MIDEETPTFDDSELVPFDIETTGFEVTDTITTLTFCIDDTYHVFINTGEHSIDASETEARLLEEEQINNVEVYGVPTERDLLVQSNSVAQEVITWDEYFVTAYNGERWNGGFDLAFLRTAAAKYDIETPFSGFYYIDLYPIFDKERINTTAPALEKFNQETKEGFHDLLDYVKWEYPEEAKEYSAETQIENALSGHPNFTSIRSWYDERSEYLCCEELPTKRYKDLVMVHYLLSVELFGQDEEAYLQADFDPFEHSKEAVTSYTEGNLTDVILHNVADVYKTYELGSFLSRISEDDVKWRQIPY